MSDTRAWLEELLDDADDITRQRGWRYFDEDRVRRIEEVQQGYQATVYGSTGLYTIKINLDRALTSCDCPAYKPCKHILAVLFALQSRSQLPSEKSIAPHTPLAASDNEVRLAAVLDSDGELCRVVRWSAKQGFRVLPVEILYYHEEREIRRITPAHQPILRAILTVRSVDHCEVRWLLQYLQGHPPATPLT